MNMPLAPPFVLAAKAAIHDKPQSFSMVQCGASIATGKEHDDRIASGYLSWMAAFAARTNEDHATPCREMSVRVSKMLHSIIPSKLRHGREGGHPSKLNALLLWR